MKIESSTCFTEDKLYPPGEHTVEVMPQKEDKYIALSALIWY